MAKGILEILPEDEYELPEGEIEFPEGDLEGELSGVDSRECEFSGCCERISDLVPEEITLCGEHQRMLRETKMFLKCKGYWPLSETDVRFVFLHRKGCLASELADLLGIEHSTFRHYLSKIKTKEIVTLKTRGRPRWIKFKLMIKLIDLSANWISVLDAARSEGLDYEVLRNYTLENIFGRYEYNLSNQLSIHRSRLETLRSEYKRIAKTRRYLGRWQKKNSQGFTTREISLLLGVTVLDVREDWMKEKGWLSYTPDKFLYIASKSQFLFFLKAVVGGYFIVPSYVKQNCQIVLAQLLEENGGK